MTLLEMILIVKNSGEILRKCLNNNKKYVDHWTILDTGSSDNTADIVREELKDIPGELHFGEFIDFSQARNKALELSSKKCKYTIILDDSYFIYGGKELRELLKKSKVSCFLIKIGKFVDGFLRSNYHSKRIIKSSENLRYKYRVHEDIMVEESKIKLIEDQNIFLDDITFKDHTKRSFDRYEKDIEMLLKDHIDYPKDQRVLYYIAKTYQMIDYYDESLLYYKKLQKIKNSREDFLFSSYYDSACIDYYKDDDLETFKNKLYLIQKIFKDRVEPTYKLAIIYRDLGDIHQAEELISTIVLKPKPILIGTILEDDIYDYCVSYMFIDINLTMGHLNKAVPLLKRMLELYPHDQPLLNMKYNICDDLTISSVNLSEDKTIVIHTSSELEIINCWKPSEDTRISGSEYMAMNLGKEFLKLGYRVFIIGTFEDKENNTNYEGIYEGIEYIDYKYFSEFALKYVIDYLIISRFTENLVYYSNIKKVYLWIHDTLPFVTHNSKFIQYHKEKFKGIIAISEWQKNNTVKKHNIPEKNIFVSRNAIYIERFLNKNIIKTPYRFIYSSSPDRGLNYLIQIIPKIKEKYPETTLHLFVNKYLIDNDTLNAIEKLEDYVYLNPRVSQDQLAIEFLKSDIWLYPTNFQESYCITALEAMAAKCLVVTVKNAALEEVVEGRGILCNYPIKDNLEDLVKKLFFVLERSKLKEHFVEKAYEWAARQTYDTLARDWINIFNI